MSSSRRLLRSPRARRRAAWLIVVGGVVGGAAALIVGMPNTGTVYAEHMRAGKAQVYVEPRSVRLTARDRAAAQAVAGRFVKTAVLRRHAEIAYDIVAPAFRQGTTRAQWRRGEIPVVPYPAGDASQVRWRGSYSYRNRLGLQVAILPVLGTGRRGQVFDIELSAVRTRGHKHWLVSSWAPAGGAVPPTDNVVAAGAGGSSQDKPALDAHWLLLPVVALLALILGVPLGLGVRGLARRRRAARI